MQTFLAIFHSFRCFLTALFAFPFLMLSSVIYAIGVILVYLFESVDMRWINPVRTYKHLKTVSWDGFNKLTGQRKDTQ